MADESDQIPEKEGIKPWTIKNIPPELRNAAVAAADRADLAIGEWLGRAIRTQVQADHQSSRAPVPVLPDAPAPRDPVADLDSIERMVAMAASLATSTGTAIPASVSRTAYSLLRKRLVEIGKAAKQ